MPYTMTWLIPHKIIYLYLSGDADIDLTKQISDAFIKFLDEGVASVYILANLGQVEKTPINLLEIRNNQTYLNHPHLGWLVVFAPQSFLRFAANILVQMTRFQLKMVGTEAEGLAFLKEIAGDTVDWSQAALEILHPE